MSTCSKPNSFKTKFCHGISSQLNLAGTPFAGTSSLTGEAFAFRTAILGQVFKLKLITRDK